MHVYDVRVCHAINKETEKDKESVTQRTTFSAFHTTLFGRISLNIVSPVRLLRLTHTHKHTYKNKAEQKQCFENV